MYTSTSNGFFSAHSEAQSEMSKAIRIKLAIGLALAFTAPVVAAQQAPDGQSIKLGNSDFYPSVRLDYVQNSNAFLNETNPTSTTAFQIRPEAIWVAQRRLLKLQASYDGVYQAASEDAINFNDHTLKAGLTTELDKRKRIDAALSFKFGHQDLGTGLTRGTATVDSEQVEYVDTDLSASFTFGAKGAQGNVSAGINIENYSYSNRSDLTQGRDKSSVEPFGIFSYRLGGDTRGTIELRYKTEDAAQDRNDLSLLAGLEFAATGKSGGSFAIGTTQSTYKAAGIDDKSNFVVEGALFWEPTKFSRLTFDVDRGLDGSAGDLIATDSSATITDTANLRWDYNWSDRLKHIASARLSAVSAECPSRGSRTTGVTLAVELDVRRWLSVGLQGGSENRVLDDCTTDITIDPNLDYDKTNVMFWNFGKLCVVLADT